MAELNNIERHVHDGVDSPKINPKNMTGFPVQTTAPNHEAPNGTIVMQDDETSVRKLFVMLGGTWYGVTLT